MGCGSCGRGRFIRQLPRGFHIWASASAEIFHREYKFVVADICPHGPNAMWCPAHAGEANAFGVRNHLDFGITPRGFDNYYFEFTPEPCPEVIKQRMSQSKCSHGWLQASAAANVTAASQEISGVSADSVASGGEHGGNRRLRGEPEPTLLQ